MESSASRYPLRVIYRGSYRSLYSLPLRRSVHVRHSAYFARPISIVVVYENTQWQRSPHTPPEPLRQPNTKAIASASVETPIIQTRQVHLQCSGKVICIATSTIRITSPNVAHLFLVDKYAIGQTFRRLDKLPVFELLSVGLGSYYLQFDASLAANKVKSDATSASPSDQCKELWRRYKLTVPGFDCDIVEVFPDREMFVHGEAWLDDRVVVAGSPRLERPGTVTVLQRRAPWLASTSNKSLLLTLGFFLVLAYELTSLVMG